ncbi:MAG: hypothetical protein ACRD0P_23875 [Stackebrandtia sp.]
MIEVNPIDDLAEIVIGAAADGFKGMLLSVWAAGLMILKWALSTMDLFVTPDLSATGPARKVYSTALWIAGVLVTVMALVQFAIASIRRDGRNLGQVATGVGQFVVIWAGWITYAGALLVAVEGINDALLEGLLGVNAWEAWDPLDGQSIGEAVTETSTAVVLAFLGCFLWLAAIGQFAIMIARAAALLILAALTPLTAAGLVSDVGKSWFWKSFRWFHAAAFTPILTTLILGIGHSLATEAAKGAADSSMKVIGTATPAVVLVLMSLVAPAALFRLLAFTDPGTSSGASLRAGMAANGGVGGIIAGRRAEATSSTTASTATEAGASQGEAQASDATDTRFVAQRRRIAAVRTKAGATVDKVAAAGSQATVVTVDALNQTSVGDGSYFPDYYNRSAPRFDSRHQHPPTAPPPVVVDAKRPPEPPDPPDPPDPSKHVTSEDA